MAGKKWTEVEVSHRLPPRVRAILDEWIAVQEAQRPADDPYPWQITDAIRAAVDRGVGLLAEEARAARARAAAQQGGSTEPKEAT